MIIKHISYDQHHVHRLIISECLCGKTNLWNDDINESCDWSDKYRLVEPLNQINTNEKKIGHIVQL